MPLESNTGNNIASTDTSPSPKNLYSIFSKTPSKPPALTPLGKSRVASTQPPADGATGTPSVIDLNSNVGRKPGFQPAPEAPLAVHIQDPTKAAPTNADVAPVDRAGSASSVGVPHAPPTPTLGVLGASAITPIGTGSSAALGNTDTRANANNKSDIESTSASFKSPPTDNYDVMLHGSDEALFQEAYEAGYRPSQFPPDITPELFLEAQTAGYDHDKHFYMGGPAVFLQACQAGYNPDKHNESGGPEVFLQAIAGGYDPIKDKCLQAFLCRWPEGRPEDPHTSDRPIYSVEEVLSGEALRHAFNVGIIEGIVPYGMEAYDPKLHGEDMDLYRSAHALGYRHEDYSEPTTPKHFMDALEVGYISARHKTMGGPVMYLKAICAGFRPGLDGSPKVFLKQHAKGKLPPGSGRSSPITPQEFREQMVADVCKSQ